MRSSRSAEHQLDNLVDVVRHPDVSVVVRRPLTYTAQAGRVHPMPSRPKQSGDVIPQPAAGARAMHEDEVGHDCCIAARRARSGVLRRNRLAPPAHGTHRSTAQGPMAEYVKKYSLG